MNVGAMAMLYRNGEYHFFRGTDDKEQLEVKEASKEFGIPENIMVDMLGALTMSRKIIDGAKGQIKEVWNDTSGPNEKVMTLINERVKTLSDIGVKKYEDISKGDLERIIMDIKMIEFNL